MEKIKVSMQASWYRYLLPFCIVCLFVAPAWAQTAVTGTVRNAEGELLEGVTVQLKGTTTATTTANNGTFEINASPTGVLVFSMIGYGTKEENIGSRQSLTVTLVAESELVDEVVVVGYNVVKKSDLTGSVVSVNSEDITAMPVANPLQALQGRAAGLDVTSNERPGEIGSIRVRGERSLLASNSPLYVVDGVPLNSGGIEFLNPKDIETIDVLKDASATAIYGSRGANGVIIVTTKRGRAGSTTLNYSVTSTIEKLNDRQEMMDAAQYIEFRRDAYRFAGQYPDAPDKDIDQDDLFGTDPYAWANVEKGWVDGKWDGSKVSTTDWGSYVTQTGVTHDHLLAASGGTDKLQAYGSFGYLNQGGTQKGQGYERFSGKLTVDITPKDWFRMGAVLNTTLGDQDYGYVTSNATGPGNLYAAARGMLPFAVPFDDNGERIELPGGDVNILNPVLETEFNVDNRRVWRNFGNIYAEITPIKGLRYRVNFGPDYYHNRHGRFVDANSVNRGGGRTGSTNQARLDNTMRFSWTLDNLLYFDRSFGEHDLGLTLLQSASYNRTETAGMTAENLPWSSQLWYKMDSVDELRGFGSDLVETQLTSYMVRANYGFKDKYLFTGSLRWDGASQLAAGNKWDIFPSMAAAWRLDQENFLEDQTWINSLKARIGFGVTGNSALDPYMTLGVLTPLYYTWGSIVEDGYVNSDPSLAEPLPMPNKDLSWEKTAQINYGIDFSLWNNRFSGSIDYFTSRTTDLLMSRSIPSVNGYTHTWDNVGTSANKGIDISLNSVNIRNGSFSWESTLNFTHSRDRIVELQNGKLDDVANVRFIGQRLFVYYDYEKVGIWQNTPEDLAEIEKFNANDHEFAPGTIRLRDVNGDYKIDADDDRVIRGHSAPNWNFGFGNTFTYKNFDLNFFIYGRMGFTIESGAESLQGRYAQRVVDYWTPDNPTNAYPAPNYSSASGDPFRSAMNYQDGSFIKLRNVSLGYTFSQNFTERIKLSKLRIYAQSMNPGLLYSKVDWIDPDTGSSIFNRGVVFGLNVGF